MRGLSKIAGALILSAFLLTTTSAQAALIQNLISEVGLGSGQIEFSTKSGNDKSGVVAFSFDVTAGPGSPQSYGLDNIDTIVWSIDDEWVLSIALVSKLTPFENGLFSAITLTQSMDGIYPCLTDAEASGSTMATQQCSSPNNDLGLLGGRLITEAVHDAPEPSTLALFLVALGGLGFMARRRVA